MKIAVLFGAKSFEHEISVVSAIALKKVLNAELVYIFCDYERNFYLIPTSEITSKRFSSGAYKKDKKLEIKQGGFFQKALMSEKKVEFDFMINLVHGADGEDGKLASILDFFGVSYIGPRLEASVLSYNKLLTKLYAKEIGVEVLSYQVINKNETYDKGSISYPCIIKPSRLGSSIGISIVKSEAEFEYALDVAFEFDNQVLIEPFIKGIKEYNLAGCSINGVFHYSIIEEPQKEEFLDFDKKYLDFSRTSRVNEASLDEVKQEGLKESFRKIYGNLFKGALIRCDFFIHEDKIYLNEINPIPGSMGNYLFSNFQEIIEKLATDLPQQQKIICEYKYINSIQAAKGK